MITGLSGSGKSSLAFDTLYAEGQRRYVESLSAYARQFLSMMEKPDVDSIEGLSPAIAIEQKATSHNPRSTVGTVTEIYDYLRLLYARAGMPRCPDHGIDLAAQTVSQMVDQVLRAAGGHRSWCCSRPLVDERKGEHAELLEELQARASCACASTAQCYEIDAAAASSIRSASTPSRRSSIASACGRTCAQRLAESFETALRLAGGLARAGLHGRAEARRSWCSPAVTPARCAAIQRAALEPRLFSFNNPVGRLPELRRPGHAGVLRSASGSCAIRTCRSPAARCAAGTGAMRYYFQLIQSLARHYEFDIETPWDELPEHVQRRAAARQRRGGRSSSATSTADAATRTRKRHAFEGIVPNLERRYRETESATVREELAKYLGTRPCPDCGGTRLNARRATCSSTSRALPRGHSPDRRAARSRSSRS